MIGINQMASGLSLYRLPSVVGATTNFGDPMLNL